MGLATAYAPDKAFRVASLPHRPHDAPAQVRSRVLRSIPEDRCPRRATVNGCDSVVLESWGRLRAEAVR